MACRNNLNKGFDKYSSPTSDGNSREDRELYDVLEKYKSVYIGNCWKSFDGQEAEEAVDFSDNLERYRMYMPRKSYQTL
jgi:hypothetical protein